MPDDAHKNAKERRDALKRHISSLEQELSEIEQFLGLYQKFADIKSDQLQGRNPISVSTAFARAVPLNQRARGNSKPKPETSLPLDKLQPELLRVLLERRRPMARGALVKALADKGVAIGGSRPNQNMGTIMWRLRAHFVNIEGHGYWPREAKCAAVGYEPASATLSG